MEPECSSLSKVRHVNENADSVEIGTPGKFGAIKVYGDASKPVEFATRIAEMFKLRAEFAEKQAEFEAKYAPKKTKE